MRVTRILGWLLLLLALALPSAAQAETGYPAKPVRIVVGYGPGGVADVTTRIVAQKLSERMNQQFVVENKPGAGGIVATSEVVKSKPDGYTLLLFGNGHAISHSLFRSLPYDDQRDLAPVSMLAFFDILMVTKAGSKLKSVKDLIAAAKANPGKLNFGCISVGSTQNLTANLFRSTAGIEATIVPFKTSPDQLTALLRGDVDVSFEIYAGIKSAVDAGQVTVMAVSGATRSDALPNVPTIAESGLPGFDVISWNAFAGPAGLPKDVVAALNKEIKAVLALPDVKARMAPMGMDPRWSEPPAVMDRFRADVKKWADVIEKVGIEKQ